MRTAVVVVLAVLELAAAAALLLFGLRLPGAGEVGSAFARADRVLAGAEGQLGSVRGQVGDLRRSEVRQLAERLRAQTGAVAKLLKARRIDFAQLERTAQALRDVAGGLDRTAAGLAPERLAGLGNGLGEAADLLDRAAPAAVEAADALDTGLAALEKNARALAELLRAAPIDLKAARDIHDGLARFDDGLAGTGRLLDAKRLPAVRDGLGGLADALRTTADRVDKLRGYSYPVVRFRGLKPEVETKPFWPEGDNIASGLRRAVEGLEAADAQLDEAAKELPRVRQGVEESRTVVARTREALGRALGKQDQLEKLLREVPDQAARLADALPKLAGGLAKVLREADKLRKVAGGLRQARDALSETARNWPEVRRAVSATAELLRRGGEEIDRAVERKDEAGAALDRGVELAEAFAQAAPLFTDGLDARLAEQERSLGELSGGLGEVRGGLPELERSAADVLAAARWLAWLVAAVVAVHACYVLAGVRNVPAGRRAERN